MALPKKKQREVSMRIDRKKKRQKKNAWMENSVAEASEKKSRH